jgi:hypothetical protein
MDGLNSGSFQVDAVVLKRYWASERLTEMIETTKKYECGDGVHLHAIRLLLKQASIAMEKKLT